MTRLEAINCAFGVNLSNDEIKDKTGCEAANLQNTPIPTQQYLTSPYSMGWFAGRTCSVDFNVKTNFPNHKGYIDFWIGVIHGLQAKGI